jgi:hypothetical protein
VGGRELEPSLRCRGVDGRESETESSREVCNDTEMIPRGNMD